MTTYYPPWFKYNGFFCNSLPEGGLVIACAFCSFRASFQAHPSLLFIETFTLHKILTHRALASSHLLRLHIYGIAYDGRVRFLLPMEIFGVRSKGWMPERKSNSILTSFWPFQNYHVHSEKKQAWKILALLTEWHSIKSIYLQWAVWMPYILKILCQWQADKQFWEVYNLRAGHIFEWKAGEGTHSLEQDRRGTLVESRKHLNSYYLLCLV